MISLTLKQQQLLYVILHLNCVNTFETLILLTVCMPTCCYQTSSTCMLKLEYHRAVHCLFLCLSLHSQTPTCTISCHHRCQLVITLFRKAYNNCHCKMSGLLYHSLVVLSVSHFPNSGNSYKSLDVSHFVSHYISTCISVFPASSLATTSLAMASKGTRSPLLSVYLHDCALSTGQM